MQLYQNKYRTQTFRLKGWDYRNAAAYFITICTHERAHFFGEIINDKMYMNLVGAAVQGYWYEIPKHFPFITLGEFQIMPNHLHGIVIIESNEYNGGGDDGTVDGNDTIGGINDGDGVDDTIGGTNDGGGVDDGVDDGMNTIVEALQCNASTMVDNDHATVGNDHPTVGNNHPTVGNNHPTVDNDHATVGNNHPTVDNDHATVGNNHSTGNNNTTGNTTSVDNDRTPNPEPTNNPHFTPDDIARLFPDSAKYKNVTSNLFEFDAEYYSRISPKKGSLASVIRSFKSVCTKNINLQIPTLAFKWQDLYWDSIIRTYEDFVRIENYIRTNPRNWKKDSLSKKNKN